MMVIDEIEQGMYIFSIILFSLVQFFICSNSPTMFTSVCSGTRRSTSSAYLLIKFQAERVFRSFLVIIYRVGPKPEPCIISRVMLSNCEHTSFTIHFCWRPVRKETIQLYILFGKSRADSLCSNISWFTTSKALLKSMTKQRTYIYTLWFKKTWPLLNL